MIVVDTNVIAYLYLQGQHTDNVEKILIRDPAWCAPLLWRSEFRNILALYIRKKILTSQKALEIMRKAEELMNGNEYSVSSHDVIDLIKSSTCSAYDCEFVCLAKELGVPLITGDKKILTEFSKYSISITAFADNP